MKINQLMKPYQPLEIHFEKFHDNGSPLIVEVEFIAVVDYDGEHEIEYGAIVDGRMMLFNVDGVEITVRRKDKTFEPVNRVKGWLQ